MTEIKLYDKENIDTLPWSEITEGSRARHFLEPLIKEGTHHYIKNVHTELKILKVDEWLLPITINEKEYTNSHVVSFYSIIGLLEEKMAKESHWWKPLRKSFIKAFAFLLRSIQINKMVMVNNWLFATTLYPKLSATQIQEITDFLERAFPEHMIVFRSVNTYSDEHLLDYLNNNGYQLLGVRDVFFFDPKQHNVMSKRDCKRDIKLLQESGYEVIDSNKFDEKDLQRGLDLYYALYIEKYTSYSPQFTKKFIEHLWHTKFLDIRGIKKNQQLDGITGFFKMYETMIVPFFGYDVEQPIDLGLYRMVNILGIQEAHQTKRVLNQSSGAADFKRVRGLVPYKEYNAIRTRHLKGFRKVFWGVSEYFFFFLLLPLIKKINH